MLQNELFMQYINCRDILNIWIVLIVQLITALSAEYFIRKIIQLRFYSSKKEFHEILG